MPLRMKRRRPYVVRRARVDPATTRVAATAVLLGIGLALLVALPAAGADRDGDGLSDAFETRWGVTDPDNRDSDGDGVVDPAEDDDGDRLSNLGEQRFRTDPGSRDSDRDGQLDGSEDADGNGVSNAIQQDRRRVPGDLRPALSEAGADVAEARAECNVALGDSELKVCTFGKTDSPTTVALVGDSHALMWVPAFRRVADQQGWKLVTLIKGACPLAAVGVKGQYRVDRMRSCRAWRDNVLAWLSDHPPDVIVVTDRSRYQMVYADGLLIPERKRPRRLRVGLTKTLMAMPASSRVVVLADAPEYGYNPVICLRQYRGNMSRCAVRRQGFRQRIYERMERSAALEAGAQFRTLYHKICSYDPCPLVQGDVLIMRDRGHVTATFARQLAPSIRSKVLGSLR